MRMQRPKPPVQTTRRSNDGRRHLRKAQKIASAYESAERESKALRQPTTPVQPTPIHSVRGKRYPPRSYAQPQRRQNATACYRCGAKHTPAECRFKDAVCHYCGKKGHIAKACHSRARDQMKTPGKADSTHHVKRE